MFFAAHRCRDPRLRRRAIAVLRAISRQEANFLRVPATDVLDRLLQCEEGEQPISTAARVAEAQRVRWVALAFDFDRCEVDTKFYIMLSSAKSFCVVKENVLWTHASLQAEPQADEFQFTNNRKFCTEVYRGQQTLHRNTSVCFFFFFLL